MVVVGSVVTVLSLIIGGAYVQASLSDQGQQEESPAEEPAGETSDQALEEDPVVPPALSGGETAVTEVPLPVPDAGHDFTVFCPAGDGTATRNTCRVRSYNGFSQPVNLSCQGTAPGIRCQFTPSTVTPPPNGNASFDLRILLADSVQPGGHVFNVTGRSGGLSNSYRYPFLLPAPPPELPPGQAPAPGPAPAAPPGPVQSPQAPSLEPSFTIACSLNPGPETVIDKLLWSVNSGNQGKIKCFVKPVNGFDEPVEMQLTNVSGNITSYEFNPPVVLPTPGSPNPNGPTVGAATFVDLNFELGNLENGEEYSFDVTGVSESLTTTRRVILTVTDQG